jgi:MerR family transcriptional regulator, light-induced transcriptional regulator
MTDLREHIERHQDASSVPRPYRVERFRFDSRDLCRDNHVAKGLAGLRYTIETDVIPRLVAAHARRRAIRSDLTVEPDDTASNEATALAKLMLTGDTASACARVELLRAQGSSLEEIYLLLLTPVAAHLRRLWSNDVCGFAEATLALWRLQQLLRQYSVEFRAEAERQETGRRVLLAPTPREKHDLSYAMFCLVLMSEFFRRDGWEAWIESDPTSQEFTQVVREQWFDVVEFLVTGDNHLNDLAVRIHMVRSESLNRSIGVMVYGPIFVEHPELALQVGADLTASDAIQAALQAQHFVGPAGRS